jgi:hypothetical protein
MKVTITTYTKILFVLSALGIWGLYIVTSGAAVSHHVVTYQLPKSKAPIVSFTEVMSNELTKVFIPVSADLTPRLPAGSPQTAMSLIEVQYCGPIDSTHGRIRGVVHAGSVPAVFPNPILSKDRCTQPLSSIAESALTPTTKSDWVGAVDMVAEFIPWKLAVRVVEADVKLNSLSTVGPLTSSLIRAALVDPIRPLAEFNTSDIPVKLRDNQQISYNLAVRFIGKNITLLLVPTAEAATFVSPLDADLAKVPAIPDNLSANAVVITSYDEINKLIATSFPDGKILVQAGGSSVAIEKFRISGRSDGINLDGNATHQGTNFKADAHIELKGPDLIISKISLKPQPQDCTSLSGTPLLQCNLNKVAVDIANKAAKSEYVDKQKPVALPDKVGVAPFEFTGKRLMLKAQVLSNEAAPESVVLFCNVLLESQ